MMTFTIGLDILWLKKSGIKYVISHNYAKIKVDLYGSLPLYIMIIYLLSELLKKIKATITMMYVNNSCLITRLFITEFFMFSIFAVLLYR